MSCLFRATLIVRTSAALVCLALVASTWVTSAACCQDVKPERLIDQAPFDVLTLDKTNDNKVFKVYPVALPGRRVPEKPKPTERLRVRLLVNEQDYDVAWVNIAKLELYEQMVLAEANKLAADGKLDDAYDDLTYLLTFYPQTPGLPEARQQYLYLSSAAAFRQQKYDEALALAEELMALNPAFRTSENAPLLLQRLGDIADRLLAADVEKRDYRAARLLVNRLAQQYKADGESFVKKWRQQLLDAAILKRDEAKSHFEAGRYVEAHDAAAAMQSIWPEAPGGVELAAEITRRHPLVRVGVEHPAVSFDSLSLHDVSARRAGRLQQRLLVEEVALSSEGGKYESPLAPLVRSDDGLSLTFRLPTAADRSASFNLAQRLAGRAREGNSAYNAAWGRIVNAISLPTTTDVQIDLRLPHVLPEALLQIPLFAETDPQAPRSQPYSVLTRDAATTRYAANSDYAFQRPGQPAEIVERFFTDPQRAISALKRGEIDVLDRVFPGDVAALATDSSLEVVPYAGPTTHVLAVSSQHSLLSNREFRRALVYGANRELLLTQGLLRGTSLPGCRVVSGPFPAPAAGGELPTYGYDDQIAPRPFDPRLALALVGMAEAELKAAYEKQQKEAPQRTPIVLGHPADECSRIACRGLAKDWKRLGVDCKLQEFLPGIFADADHQCDLVYLQLSAWEPIVDANRLLGPGGLAPTDNPFIQLALREIGSARNWQQARERLVTLHRLLREDMTLLPLWQTIDHFAYRRIMRGITSRPVRLYQDVEQWRLAPSLARSTP